MEIWVNPACSKCRAATAAFDEARIAYTVRRYLDDPPTADELRATLARLDLEPWQIVRMGETAAAPLKSVAKDADHREQWIAAMVADPILIQRPIITADDGSTAVARDPETLSRFLARLQLIWRDVLSIGRVRRPSRYVFGAGASWLRRPCWW